MLQECNKFNTAAGIVKQKFLSHLNNYYLNYLFLFTDGSKINNSTSSAFYVHRYEIKFSVKINKNVFIFTAELYAIFKALCWISQNQNNKNVILKT